MPDAALDIPHAAAGVALVPGAIQVFSSRSARALLRWQQRDLAAASAVSLATVKRLEATSGVLIAHASTVTALRRGHDDSHAVPAKCIQPGVQCSSIVTMFVLFVLSQVSRLHGAFGKALRYSEDGRRSTPRPVCQAAGDTILTLRSTRILSCIEPGFPG